MSERLWKNLVFLLVAGGMVFGMVRYAIRHPGVQLKPGVTRPLPPSPPVKPGQSGMPPCLLSTPALSEGKPVIQSVVADCLVLIPGEDRLNVFEVDLSRGTFLHVATDFFLPAQPAIAFTRVTRPVDDWHKKYRVFLLHLYDVFNIGDTHPYTYVGLHVPHYALYRFERISVGTGYADALYRHEAKRTVLYGSEISWNGSGWDLRLRDGLQLFFPDSYGATLPEQSAAIGLRNSSGQLLRLLRDSEHKLLKVVAEDGRWLEIHRDGDHISAIKDGRGNLVQYSYDRFDRLQSVVRPDGTSLSYSYGDSNRITAINKGDLVLVRNEYDATGRIVKQTFADEQNYCFAYSLDSEGYPQETKIIPGHGRAISVGFHDRTYEIRQSLSLEGCR